MRENLYLSKIRLILLIWLTQVVFMDFFSFSFFVNNVVLLFVTKNI